jgi:hypothetical protein
MVAGIFASLAEYERELIHERRGRGWSGPPTSCCKSFDIDSPASRIRRAMRTWSGVSARGRPGLFAAGAGCLPGDGGTEPR